MKRLLMLVSLVGLVLVGSVRADQDVSAELEALKTMVMAQQERISELEASNTEDGWLTARRQEEIKSLIQEVLADADSQAQLAGAPLTAGYKNGFFIRTEDDTFLLRINALMQIRYTGINRDVASGRNFGNPVWDGEEDEYYGASPREDDRSDFELTRVRLLFSGHVWNKDLTYLIQIALTAEDAPVLGTQQPVGHLTDGYVNWRADNALQIMAGQFKLPFGRQELTSPGKLQFVDRSLANETFNLDRAVGLAVHGYLFEEVREQFLYYAVAVSNGAQTRWDNDFQQALDDMPAFTARGVFNILGDVGSDESDLAVLQNPALAVGMSYHWESVHLRQNRHTRHTVGVPGFGNSSVLAAGTRFHQIGSDIRFKWMGLSVNTEYWCRVIDNASRPMDEDEFEDEFVEKGHPVNYATAVDRATRHYQGGHLQVGYYLGDDLPIEPVFRLGGVWDNNGENVWEIAGGVNYYLKGHNLKISADVTRIADSTASSPTAGFGLNEDAWMIRGQLQVAF